MSGSFLDRICRRALFSRLEHLREGEIVLEEGADRSVFGKASGAHPLRATLRVHSPRFFTEVALGGSIGAGEAYMAGLWSCDDLTALVRILARDRRLVASLEGGAARLGIGLNKWRHRARRNTPERVRLNIAAHYDLGNDFFALFLDPSMMYSCAIFERGDSSLEEASLFKIDRICRDLALGPGDEVLEIGSGWGALAVRAASRYGCRVTTTTVSTEQFEMTRARAREAGVEERVTVLLEDYRDLERKLGRRFPKAVSVEMIEAVGYRYLDDYFRACSELLEPGGAMLLQAIVIDDTLFDAYRRSVDFIQTYIFPGGFLPSLGAIRASVARAGDLSVIGVRDITGHYPPTLRAWRERFRASRDRLREMGFSDEFVRMWEFYFCYCEAGFLERTIGDVQILLGRPGCPLALEDGGA